MDTPPKGRNGQVLVSTWVPAEVAERFRTWTRQRAGGRSWRHHPARHWASRSGSSGADHRTGPPGGGVGHGGQLRLLGPAGDREAQDKTPSAAARAGAQGRQGTPEAGRVHAQGSGPQGACNGGSEPGGRTAPIEGDGGDRRTVCALHSSAAGRDRGTHPASPAGKRVWGFLRPAGMATRQPGRWNAL